MKLAVVGGGPAALLILKELTSGQYRLTEPGSKLTVSIFEAGDKFGCGMPYSRRGSKSEHIANVSSDELPAFDVSLTDWVKSLPIDKLKQFGIKSEEFHSKECPPRLLLGEYLNAQFDYYVERARAGGIEIQLEPNTAIEDISPDGPITITTESGESKRFDRVIICTGHHRLELEGDCSGPCFDSPYPPGKIAIPVNGSVGLRGSSLTAIDAVRTLARRNGRLEKNEEGVLEFIAADESPDFKIVMYSIDGLLPCVRVHMKEPHLSSHDLLSNERIEQNKAENDGFLELDFVFKEAFIEPLKESSPESYDAVKDLDLESFVDAMLELRKDEDSFDLLRSEYKSSLESIASKRPIHWKELLAGLSFAVNFPAKHLSAEDMLRLRKVLKPLIAIVIAFVPQSSCEELLALYDAGRIELRSDNGEGKVSVENGKVLYRWEDADGEHVDTHDIFVECIGQKPLEIEDFPFRSLVKQGAASRATLLFRSREAALEFKDSNPELVEESGESCLLRLPGLAISDEFQVIDANGKASDEIYLVAVPFIGGYNPDYSGLDFCERAAKLVVARISQTVSVFDSV